MSEKIVQLNEEVIKGQLKELVRGSVEETLNGLLEAEAQKLPQAARYERNEHTKATTAATIAETSLPLPGMLPSRFPSSKGFPLRPLLLNGTAAGKAVWEKPL